jgi:hypothetical protein
MPIDAPYHYFQHIPVTINLIYIYVCYKLLSYAFTNVANEVIWLGNYGIGYI